MSNQSGSGQAVAEAHAGSPALTGSAGGTHESNHQQDQTIGGKTFAAEELLQVPRFEGQRDRQHRRKAGRRSRTRTRRKQGRYITSVRVPRVNDLALDATLREAAPYQRQRRGLNGTTDGSGTLVPESGFLTSIHGSLQPKIILRRDDLRQKVRVRRTRNAVCFVVDASWSMAAEERMRSTKAAVLSLLHDAYQRRDQVGLVSFQRDYAHVLLPLTSSVDLARKCLQTMPTGGKTPLARGLLTGYEVLERARLQDQEIIPLLVLLTDGQANVSMGNLPPQSEAYRVADFIANRDIHAIVIDTEHPNFERGLARQLAEHLKGIYYRLDDLNDGDLAQAVRMQMRI